VFEFTPSSLSYSVKHHFEISYTLIGMSESAKNPTTAPSESTESTHVVPESILQLQGKKHLSVSINITHAKQLNHFKNLGSLNRFDLSKLSSFEEKV
jgi:hypothetical protein